MEAGAGVLWDEAEGMSASSEEFGGAWNGVWLESLCDDWGPPLARVVLAVIESSSCMSVTTLSEDVRSN